MPTDAAGFATLPIDEPGTLIVSAADPARGVTSLRALPRPDERITLVLGARPADAVLRVLDATTGAPVVGALLDDGGALLGAPSDAEGRLAYWTSAMPALPMTLARPGSVPRRVASVELSDGAELLLPRQARLHWSLASDAIDRASVEATLSPGLERLLPQWDASALLSGEFVVPREARVRIDVSFAGGSATGETIVSTDDVSLELRPQHEGPTLTLHVETRPDPPRPLVVLGQGRQRVPFIDGRAEVPRPETAWAMLVPVGDLDARLQRDTRASADPARGRIDLDTPPATLQTIRVQDARGSPLPGVALHLSGPILAGGFASSHPAWVPVTLQGDAPDVSDAAGRIVLRLPPGGFEASATRTTLLGRDSLRVDDAQGEHVLTFDVPRWLELSVTWDDGRAVESFVLSWSTDWWWTTFLDRGRQGRWAGWISGSVDALDLTTEGAVGRRLLLSPERTREDVVLARAAYRGALTFVGLDPGVDVLRMQLFVGGMNRDALFVERDANGTFEAPDPLVLEGKQVLITYDAPDGSEFTTDFLDGDRLATTTIVFVPEEDS